MPADPSPFWPFGVTLAAICIPLFGLIGFLSTNFGYNVWAAKTKQLYRWLRPKPKPAPDENAEFEPNPVNRTLSTEEGMQMRLGQGQQPPQRRSSHRPAPSHPHIQRMVAQMGEGRQSGLMRMGTMVNSVEIEREKENEESGSTGKDTIIDVKEG